jgi:hypothetical protein
MNRPSFQFYPADWLGNSNLRRCTHNEKGAWIDVLCLMHDAAEYGVLRWPLADIAQAVGCPVEALHSLISKGVMKGSDDAECEPLIFTPRHANKDGAPVTLISAQEGPVWYSSRMVVDEHKRQVRGIGTRFGVDGEGEKAAPKPIPEAIPIHAPKPPFGDGASSSSSVYTVSKDTVTAPPSSAPSNPKEIIFTLGVHILTGQGEKESQARSFLGKFAGRDEAKLAEVIGHLAANPKVEAKSYIAGAFKPEARELVI